MTGEVEEEADLEAVMLKEDAKTDLRERSRSQEKEENQN